jgi:PilZ domain
MSARTPRVFAEKRRIRRARRYRRARCVFNNGASVLDVTLRDITPVGAKIAGDQLFCLPETFELGIRDGDGGYSVRGVRVVWLAAATAGLEFVD